MGLKVGPKSGLKEDFKLTLEVVLLKKRSRLPYKTFDHFFLPIELQITSFSRFYLPYLVQTEK